jgi:hypothetical protein
MALPGWFKAALLALGALFVFSGCFVVTTDHHGGRGYRGGHRRGYSGGYNSGHSGGYSNGKSSHGGYKSGNGHHGKKSGYKSGSNSCPSGHKWDDGRCKKY